MNLVSPFYPTYRLNPARPTVWFVGADDDDNFDKIETDLLPEGQPYMLPVWWTRRWGPFTKAEANAIIDKALADRRAHGGQRARYEEMILPRERETYETTPEPLGQDESEVRRSRGRTTPPPSVTHTGSGVLAQLVGMGLQWRCASEMGASVHTWQGADSLIRRVQGRHHMMGNRIRSRITCVKIAPNTWLLDPNRQLRETETAGSYLIQYHRTIILIYHRNGMVTLNTGGHSTPTTRQRINDYLPPGWLIGTLRVPRGMGGGGIVHTRSGFTGREWTRRYWFVFWRDQRGPTPYAPYRDGLVLPPM